MGTDLSISALDGSDELATITGRLLHQLPTWFGMPAANAAYVNAARVNAARELPGLVARAGEQPVGMALCRHHFPQSAELHLMAISPEWHRRGIGRAMNLVMVMPLRQVSGD